MYFFGNVKAKVFKRQVVALPRSKRVAPYSTWSGSPVARNLVINFDGPGLEGGKIKMKQQQPKDLKDLNLGG